MSDPDIKPPISWRELQDLENEVTLPTKSLPSPAGIDVWTLTKKLKSEMSLGGGPAVSVWRELSERLSLAVEKGDRELLDEFAKAWTSWGAPGKPWSIGLPLGSAAPSYSITLPGKCESKPRRPKSLAVLDAIKDIQDRLSCEDPPIERAPTHKELLELVGKREGIDDTELSRQLLALRLQGRINESHKTS